MRKINSIFVLFFSALVFFMASCDGADKPLPKTFKISFDANGGTGEMESQLFTQSKPQALKLNAFTRKGYVFTGWNTVSDESGTPYSDGQEITIDIPNDFTLYAVWTAGEASFKVEHYKQKVNLTDYELAETETRAGKTGETTKALPKQYAGFKPASFENDEIKGDGSTVAKVFYDREKYTLTFKANGGSAEPVTQNFTFGVEQDLRENSFEWKDGDKEYFFVKWNTAADGTGTSYTNKQKVQLTENLTLFAQWKESNGGLYGTAAAGYYQGQSRGNIEVTFSSGDKKTFGKTEEVVIVPKGQTAIIKMSDNSSWDKYYVSTQEDSWFDPYYQGVFVKDRKVKLSPYIINKYEVTQELWASVMGEPETSARLPQGTVGYKDIAVFCNELTKMSLGSEHCVYYSNPECTAIYTASDASGRKPIYAAIDSSTHKFTKKGYRLPTTAEWEFAARGGDPNAEDWTFAFSGIQITEGKKINGGEDWLKTDENLDKVGVYSKGGEILEVGSLAPNKLGLFDMSGNVSEICFENWYDTEFETEFAAFIQDGYYINPGAIIQVGNADKQIGGSKDGDANECVVSSVDEVSNPFNSIGFRLARSLSD